MLISATTSNRSFPASRLHGFGTTIFTEMTVLAQKYNAVNLGQGFPDFDGPDWLLESAIQAIRAGRNQYARMFGLPELNAAIAEHQRRFYGLDYDGESEITVFAGATEAIFATIQALCEPGDDVVVFEPYYDSYRASLSMAGARESIVSLHAPAMTFDPAALERAIGPRTRAILLNSPHNPSGKLFSRDELELIATLCRRHDLIAISDEVYEHLVYDGEHIPIATLPEMRDRTITISSAGKTFSVTGWKIGWACSSPALTRGLRTAHQFITFCNGTPFQVAVAAALGADDRFYRELTSRYRARRDRLCAGLRSAGLEVLTPAGAYFAIVDIRSLGLSDGEEFCRQLPARHGVAAIPCSAFYSTRALGLPLVRFAFCKTDAVLDAGVAQLQGLRR
ncbi:MAG: methionine aminotransferase [Acidobacteriota bacterium]